MNEMEKEQAMEKEWNNVSFGNAGKRDILPPPGYFDQLPDRIMDRWVAEKAKPVKKLISLRQMVASAAIVCGICFGVAWWTYQGDRTASTNEISGADAYQYILEHMDEFAPLLNQPDQWAEDSDIDASAPDAIEEFLIEELEGEDLETIF
jgi:hypothetical protein